ncbi:unnamed protein product [Rhizophagus irregularis]|uniref:Uncharacterized protein n=1 Tax=Rhizophagus irregularis TaxID=588596 RepID=A0A915ZBX3_9GLOM|nr:unnamed protein product [Rhizophagus irregularis]CAB5117239.1 unnamed protein product [Rhizophagus irregularis]CAB5368645.1 unnamed protein product [Rhizophagus irregularis]
MGKSKKHYKKCTANKSVIKKPKIVYTLNDIIFKNCDELERHKKLKEHTHFLEVINETTVRFTKQPTLECFWKNQKLKEQKLSELSHVSAACSGLIDEKYHNYILLSPSQYSGGRRPDIIAYKLFPGKFPNQKIIHSVF